MKEIKKHPLKWLATYPGDYVDLRYNGTADEKAAVLDEMVDMIIKMIEPKFPENIITLARSHAMWDKKLTEKTERSREGKIKFKEQRERIKELETTLGIGKDGTPALPLDAPKKGEYPSLEEALAFAATIGAEHAEEWYYVSSNNGWRDKYGKEIRNWQAAMRGFERKYDPDFTPKTEQQQENEQ